MGAHTTLGRLAAFGVAAFGLSGCFNADYLYAINDNGLVDLEQVLQVTNSADSANDGAANNVDAGAITDALEAITSCDEFDVLSGYANELTVLDDKLSGTLGVRCTINGTSPAAVAASPNATLDVVASADATTTATFSVDFNTIIAGLDATYGETAVDTFRYDPTARMAVTVVAPGRIVDSNATHVTENNTATFEIAAWERAAGRAGPYTPTWDIRSSAQTNPPWLRGVIGLAFTLLAAAAIGTKHWWTRRHTRASAADPSTQTAPRPSPDPTPTPTPTGSIVSAPRRLPRLGNRKPKQPF